jgi:hypothetical protein
MPVWKSSLYFTSLSKELDDLHLADSHLLDHICLPGSARCTSRGASTGLLLEDLPKLKTLIGSWNKLAMRQTIG